MSTVTAMHQPDQGTQTCVAVAVPPAARRRTPRQLRLADTDSRSLR